MVEITNSKPLALSEIQVEGFKSLRDRVSVALGGLTILAGANSSGKSSLMQPLLLFKQTFERPYDPGPLWLDGPNVVFSDIKQIFWTAAGRSASTFTVKLSRDEGNQVEIVFREARAESSAAPIEVAECTWRDPRGALRLRPEMSKADIAQEILAYEHPTRIALDEIRTVERYRSLMYLNLNNLQPLPNGWRFFASLPETVIHVPGLRGNPARTYKRTGAGVFYPGLFHDYVASVIFQWQREKNSEELLTRLEEDLSLLGLTAQIESRSLGVAELELRVGRLRTQQSQDLVSIADVGFGVSQVLPVVVALLAARSGQIVYLEQPEIHLHPRAQVALAEVIARAANRGVQVIVETHSELLLLGIQSLVAREQLAPDKVKLHWFTRDEEGVTRVVSADLDEDGAFGEWPVDFADVSMEIMRAYLDAATARQRGKQ